MSTSTSSADPPGTTRRSNRTAAMPQINYADMNNSRFAGVPTPHRAQVGPPVPPASATIPTTASSAAVVTGQSNSQGASASGAVVPSTPNSLANAGSSYVDTAFAEAQVHADHGDHDVAGSSHSPLDAVSVEGDSSAENNDYIELNAAIDSYAQLAAMPLERTPFTRERQFRLRDAIALKIITLTGTLPAVSQAGIWVFTGPSTRAIFSQFVGDVEGYLVQLMPNVCTLRDLENASLRAGLMTRTHFQAQAGAVQSDAACAVAAAASLAVAPQQLESRGAPAPSVADRRVGQPETPVTVPPAQPTSILRTAPQVQSGPACAGAGAASCVFTHVPPSALRDETFVSLDTSTGAVDDRLMVEHDVALSGLATVFRPLTTWKSAAEAAGASPTAARQSFYDGITNTRRTFARVPDGERASWRRLVNETKIPPCRSVTAAGVSAVVVEARKCVDLRGGLPDSFTFASHFARFTSPLAVLDTLLVACGKPDHMSKEVTRLPRLPTVLGPQINELYMAQLLDVLEPLIRVMPQPARLEIPLFTSTTSPSDPPVTWLYSQIQLSRNASAAEQADWWQRATRLLQIQQPALLDLVCSKAVVKGLVVLPDDSARTTTDILPHMSWQNFLEVLSALFSRGELADVDRSTLPAHATPPAIPPRGRSVPRGLGTTRRDASDSKSRGRSASARRASAATSSVSGRGDSRSSAASSYRSPSRESSRDRGSGGDTSSGDEARHRPPTPRPSRDTRSGARDDRHGKGASRRDDRDDHTSKKQGGHYRRHEDGDDGKGGGHRGHDTRYAGGKTSKSGAPRTSSRGDSGTRNRSGSGDTGKHRSRVVVLPVAVASVGTSGAPPECAGSPLAPAEVASAPAEPATGPAYGKAEARSRPAPPKPKPPGGPSLECSDSAPVPGSTSAPLRFLLREADIVLHPVGSSATSIASVAVGAVLDTGSAAPMPLIDSALWHLVCRAAHSAASLPQPRPVPSGTYVAGLGESRLPVHGVVSCPVSIHVHVNGCPVVLSGSYDMWVVDFPRTLGYGVIFSFDDLKADGPAGRLFSLSTGSVPVSTFVPPDVSVPRAYRTKLLRERPPPAAADPSFTPSAWLRPLFAPPDAGKFTSADLGGDPDSEDPTFITLGPEGTRPVLPSTEDPVVIRDFLRRHVRRPLDAVDVLPVSTDSKFIDAAASPADVRRHIAAKVAAGDEVPASLSTSGSAFTMATGKTACLPGGVAFNALLDVLAKHAILFSDLPEKPQFSVPIELSDYTPISVPHGRPVHPRLKGKVDECIAELVRIGVLEPAPDSKWASPVVFAPKRNGGVRLCGDFTRINARIVKKQLEMPRIADLLNSCTGYSCFSSIDLLWGFFQVEVDENCRDFLTVIIGDQKFRHRRMPMGPKNSPAEFASIMQSVLSSAVLEGICNLYVDDILIKTRSPTDHLAAIDKVLGLLAAAGLRINLPKCVWMSSSASYLGQILDGKSRRIDPERLQGLRDMGLPRTVKQLRSFLGFANYYGVFVEGLAARVAPFAEYATSKRLVPRKWPPEHIKAFEDVKAMILAAQPLVLPDLNKPFVLRTDASDIAAGAVLLQADASGKLGPVAFMSARFSAQQARYNTTERECLAIVLAFTKFEDLLRFSDVRVETDHRNLVFMQDSSNPRVRRWCSFLSSFDFTVDYIPGEENVIADALSRVDPPPVNPFTVLVQTAVTPTATPASDDELLLRVWRAQRSAPSEMIAEWEASDMFSVRYRNGHALWHMQDLLWIPDTADATSLKDYLLGLAHDQSGHGAVRRTLARLADARVTWRDLRASVERYVATCTSCQMGKAPARLLRHGSLHPIPASGPGELAVADFLGPFTPSVDGFSYVLVVMDKFSRYAELIPCKHADGPSVVAALRNEYFYRHDFPKRLRTDQGSHFANSTVAKFLESCGVAHDLSPPLRPQSQGVVERLNHVIEQELKVLCGANTAAWLQLVPAVRWHVNTALNVSLGVSPFEARYGVPPRGLLASALGTPLPSFESPKHLSIAVDALHDRIRFIQDTAFDRYKAHHDKSSKPIGFEIGQRVSMLTSSSKRSGKLAWSHVGPFEVVAKVHDNVYSVRDLRATGTHNSSDALSGITDQHVSRLLPLDTSRVGDAAAAAVFTPPPYTINKHRFKTVSGSPSLQLEVTFKGLDPVWLAANRISPSSALKRYLKDHGLTLSSRTRRSSVPAPAASASTVPSASTPPSILPAATRTPGRLPVQKSSSPGVVRRRRVHFSQPSSSSST